MGRWPRSWRVSDRVLDTLVTGFSARVGVVDVVFVLHASDPYLARFQTSRKPDAAGSVVVSATGLKPPPATLGVVSAHNPLPQGLPGSSDHVIELGWVEDRGESTFLIRVSRWVIDPIHRSESSYHALTNGYRSASPASRTPSPKRHTHVQRVAIG
ncbi:MAG: hypothetical protein WED83_03725 [Acidimicrobiia bacterium]